MQYTHTTDDDDYEYPEDLLVEDVHVYLHPSLMACSHNYSCPVCREKHAVMSKGLMTPCWGCREEGWKLHKPDTRPF